MIRLLFAVLGAALVAILAAGCQSTTAPTIKVKAPAIREIGYDINIPTIAIVTALKNRYPDGVTMPPLEAQRTFDYTLAYRGTPNVYYGEVGPKCEYILVGIVVAPRAVAGMNTFTALDWPLMEPGYTYGWHGRFVLALPAPPGTYEPALSGPCK